MMPAPVLQRPPRCRCSLRGVVGDYLRAVTDQWLLVAPRANPAMLEMFADRDVRPYRNLVPWAGEFAGKYLTSAVQVLRTTGDRRLRAGLRDFVGQLVRRQAPDGYLGPWPKDSRLTGRAPNAIGQRKTWDAWGHYHLMLGLLLWSDETGDRRALAAAGRIGDLFCRKFLGPKAPRLVDTGETDKNLAPVHSLALLYARTGRQRYRDLALQIVDEFAARGRDGPLAGDYLRQALADREFFRTPKPRWESLHAILGLAELHWRTGAPAYRQAFEQIWWSIVRGDRHNTGGFSAGEQATGNPYDPRPIETCCTIAWIATSVEMLKLTGNPIVADEIELATLNAVLGLHARSGRWATYNTPSDGVRFASAHQIVFQARAGSPELNCCSVNGPRGLGLISDWAVLTDGEGVYLNYFGPSTFRVPVRRGLTVEIRQVTDYPVSGRIAIRVAAPRSAVFPLHLRIPCWSRRTRIRVNGRRRPVPRPGTYWELTRRWSHRDKIDIDLDLSPHFWRGENQCRGLTSVYRGPVLLAYDQRYNRSAPAGAARQVFGGDPWRVPRRLLAVPALDAAALRWRPATWRDWLPPLLLLEARTARGRPIRLCDYASAGQTGSPYRSWLLVRRAPKRRPFEKSNPLRSAPAR